MLEPDIARKPTALIPDPIGSQQNLVAMWVFSIFILFYTIIILLFLLEQPNKMIRLHAGLFSSFNKFSFICFWTENWVSLEKICKQYYLLQWPKRSLEWWRVWSLSLCNANVSYCGENLYYFLHMHLLPLDCFYTIWTSEKEKKYARNLNLMGESVYTKGLFLV